MRTRRQVPRPLYAFRPQVLIGSTVLLVVTAVLPLLTAGNARADSILPLITRVEEDWELAIADPDPTANAPQVVIVFGPGDPELDTHAVFELNHGTMPQFAEGGMQLQCWWRDYLLTYRNHPNTTEFEASIDTVTFTTVTKVGDGKLTMEIINGDSLTWGKFGGQGYLKIALSSWRTDLNSYDANKSVEHSRVSYGANRVNRLVRREVRYYSVDGLVSTDSEDRYVHQLVVDQPASE